MAYSTLVDDHFDRLAATTKPGSRRIGPGFNGALFAFHFLVGIFDFVASGRARAYHFGGILLSSLLDFGRFAVVAMIAAWFVKRFWHLLVETVATVRPIDYQEALAIILVVGLFGP